MNRPGQIFTFYHFDPSFSASWNSLSLPCMAEQVCSKIVLLLSLRTFSNLRCQCRCNVIESYMTLVMLHRHRFGAILALCATLVGLCNGPIS